MDLKISGKKALVMGGSTGLGRAIAERLVAEGAEVAICSRDEGRLKEAAAAIGAKHRVACDLGQPHAGREAVKKAQSLMGAVDILVTNTGGPPKGQFMDVTPEGWQQGFQGLWMSAVEAMQAAIPGMRERKWGRLLLVTSAAAREPMAGLTISNGLRAGLLGLTKSISNEIAGQGITINSLLPGYTDTDRLKELKIPADAIAKMIPAGRLGRPDELAALAAFLASEWGSYITGQAVAVDGGYLHGI